MIAPRRGWIDPPGIEIVVPAEDPLRCRCPICVGLDALYPGEGYQLGFWPYELRVGYLVGAE